MTFADKLKFFCGALKLLVMRQECDHRLLTV